MDTTILNSILSFIIICGQVGMFFFFKQQIKSKNRVIEDLQTLMDMTDIKRLSEYYKATDEIRAKNVKSQVDLMVDNWYREHYADWGHKFDEVATFTASLLEAMGKENATMIVERDMPHCKDVFANFIIEGATDNKDAGSDSKT